MTDPTPLIRLASIQVGQVRRVAEVGPANPNGQAWETGFYKIPVTGPVAIGLTNLSGDQQADLKNHGGVDKAICAYAAAHYPYWRATLGISDFPHGAFGENFTLSGLVEGDVCLGDVYQAGSAVIQVSQPRQPCWKTARRWQVKDLTAQMIETGYTGWYFRVLEEGEVEAGEPLELIERPHPEWTIAAANEVMYRHKSDRAATLALAACAALSPAWRDSLRARAGNLE
jgi:MOSC domain-containing protein YiiM